MCKPAFRQVQTADGGETHAEPEKVAATELSLEAWDGETQGDETLHGPLREALPRLQQLLLPLHVHQAPQVPSPSLGLLLEQHLFVLRADLLQGRGRLLVNACRLWRLMCHGSSQALPELAEGLRAPPPPRWGGVVDHQVQVQERGAPRAPTLLSGPGRRQAAAGSDHRCGATRRSEGRELPVAAGAAPQPRSEPQGLQLQGALERLPLPPPRATPDFDAG
mmetsp:Transcript_55859/g.179292  ORF Transcript_55859/g.179292 Transcript_55859/m.179292 type:complete len:221 (-) Transcript_55859:109-771(-)